MKIATLCKRVGHASTPGPIYIDMRGLVISIRTTLIYIYICIVGLVILLLQTNKPMNIEYLYLSQFYINSISALFDLNIEFRVC